MAAPKIMNGARARLQIYDPASKQFQTVGIFNSVQYGLVYDAQPAYILGRYSPAEIDYTAQEPVQITCTGWRVVHHGPHKDAMVPKLEDLLTHEYLTLSIVDRQLEAAGGDGRIATFSNVRPTGYSTTITNRQLEEITVNFVGILVDDEDTQNRENVKSTDLPV